MSKTNHQFLVAQPDTLPVIATADKPALGPNDIRIRVHAIAINPADVKMVYHGARNQGYPYVPGLDGAGFVDAVGENIVDLAPGDRVAAVFGKDRNSGSYQEFVTVSSRAVAKIPASWTFEDAATLPVCYMTAVVGLGLGLGTPLPFLPGGPPTGLTPSSVLVLGGASALGAATIQLLRIAFPSCIILATSSPKHHGLIKTLGADTAIARKSNTLVQEVKAATPESRGVEAIIDLVGAGADDGSVFDALDPDGPKKYAQVWTGAPEIKTPQGVDSVLFRSRDRHLVEGSENIMLSLQQLLETGQYKLPLPIYSVGQGLESLQKGLDLMTEGVSGEKLVVAI